MIKVAIIGYGYVGKAYHKVFPEALVYDPFTKDIKSSSKEEVNKCELAIICVPTPTSEDGKSCDTSIVEGTFEWLETPLILIKSTVKPGTTAKLQKKYPKLNIAFSPEYIGEGGYFIPYWIYPHPTDPQYHDFMIIGGDKKVTSKILNIFIRKLGAHVKYMQTDTKTAEVIKYMENVFLATKITLVNEFYDICEALGVDYNEAREGWLMDSRIGRSHTGVFVDKRGFEGKCLPKDLKAFISSSEEAGYDPKLLKEILDSNNRIRNKHGFERV